MRIERITDTRRFFALQDKWNEFLSSSEQDFIFLTHQWFSSWWQAFSEGKSLEILILKDDRGGWIGIAPLVIEENTLKFIASQEVTDYCDFIVAKGRNSEFYQSLLDFLGRNLNGIERIELINIKASSPTLDFFQRLTAKHNFTVTIEESEVTPILTLPSSYEDFLALLNRKDRHELRRKLRRMEELAVIKTLTIDDESGLQTWMETFIDLHRRSNVSKEVFWAQKGMKPFFREIAANFSRKGWIELDLLLQGDLLMASLITFSYQGIVYFYNMAFNKEFSTYSPGLFLFHNRLKRAILEKKKAADFLRGSEKYKYYFGAKDSKIFNLILTSGVSDG